MDDELLKSLDVWAESSAAHANPGLRGTLIDAKNAIIGLAALPGIMPDVIAQALVRAVIEHTQQVVRCPVCSAASSIVCPNCDRDE